MSKVETNSHKNTLLDIIWPIENKELPKFIPMAFMMFLLLLNYSMLRSIKDGFVVTHIGPEAISFLKTYVVLPSAIIAMVIYAQLCNLMSQQNVFYVITAFFAAYLTFFALVLYPDPDSYHPNTEFIHSLAEAYPNFQWFIKIAGKWTYASFYTMAELWGSIMISLLFWQFANQITKTLEAKRFYSMFGMLGNFGLIMTSVVLSGSLSEDDTPSLGFEFVLGIAVVSTLLIMVTYWWMQKNILTNPLYYEPAEKKNKKKKEKLSLIDSAKLIFSSRYLGLIAVLVFAYGISINLVEGVWKAKLKLLYPTVSGYTIYMGNFQKWQGIGAILFMIVGSNILRLLPWRVAALFTPLMILVTGSAFFAFIIFDNIIAGSVSMIIATSPLALAVLIGAVQNVLSKATKYSLFDATKEMAYIPLDDELKTKGKAAVDVVGGRLGKSGGGIIQSTTFILFPALSFVEATPFFGLIFVLIVVIWAFAVNTLSKDYESALENKS
ncbi:MAG: Npt1/Npt2 family nucleotide transporter [Rickettsiaceae bacterium]|nr:Npt1/Npt2 family nucleotide transporter [Rickettsiaceae bacterium]